MMMTTIFSKIIFTNLQMITLVLSQKYSLHGALFHPFFSNRKLVHINNLNCLERFRKNVMVWNLGSIFPAKTKGQLFFSTVDHDDISWCHQLEEEAANCMFLAGIQRTQGKSTQTQRTCQTSHTVICGLKAQVPILHAPL